MTVHQVAAVLNSVVEQATGQKDIVATDLTNLVSLGNTILSSDTSRDKFLDALVDRIGKTIISNRSYGGKKNPIKMDAFTYGAVMQKIYVTPPTAENAPQWDLRTGEVPNQFIIKTPEAKQKLFSDRNTYEINITVPDYQLQTAFTSAEQMSAFIDAIFVAVSNAQAMREDATTDMTYANCIGENIAYSKKPDAKGIHVVNLLTDYNTLTGGTLTAAKAMRDFEFLQYATRELQLYVKRFERMSTLFNAEQYQRFTPRESARLTVLQDFASSCEVYLRSTTYHDNLVTLPNYNEVAFWQGSGDYKFSDTSSINITTSSGTVITQSGIVALLTDIEALGMMVDYKRTRSVRNERGEYTNYFYKTDERTFVDMSENALVFLVADTAGA